MFAYKKFTLTEGGFQRRKGAAILEDVSYDWSFDSESHNTKSVSISVI